MQGECKEPLGTGCWTWFYVNVDADDFWWQSLLSFFSFPHSFSSPTTSHCFSTVGLIYVNPGGPVGNKGIPAASAKNIRFPVFFSSKINLLFHIHWSPADPYWIIRTIFARMSMNDSETVALIGDYRLQYRKYGLTMNITLDNTFERVFHVFRCLNLNFRIQKSNPKRNCRD